MNRLNELYTYLIDTLMTYIKSNLIWLLNKLYELHDVLPVY